MIFKQNDELKKQIFEMNNRGEKLKIEKLLEDKLQQDPENIDLLFRIAMLNIWPPFVDYSTSFLYLERIVSVSKKYRAIAELVISYRIYGMGFMPKNIIYWFYAGKGVINELVKPLIKQISEHGIFIDIPEKTRLFFEDELKQNPNDIEAMLLLAIMDISATRDVDDKSTKLLEKIIDLSKEIEAKALIVFAYLMDFSHIDDVLLNKLNNLNTKSNEVNSMLKYMISIAYDKRGDDILEEKYLKESVDLYQGHVNNCRRLACIYRMQGKTAEADKLKRLAMSNVKIKDITKRDLKNHDSTDVDTFLDELVRGVTSASAYDLKEI